jgi:hypothetical protein
MPMRGERACLSCGPPNHPERVMPSGAPAPKMGVCRFSAPTLERSKP